MKATQGAKKGTNAGPRGARGKTRLCLSGI